LGGFTREVKSPTCPPPRQPNKVTCSVRNIPIFLHIGTKVVPRLAAACASTPLDDLDQPARYDAFVAEQSIVLAQNYTMQRLASQAVKVHGLWRNACALGISDCDLQAFFDLAWEILMKALTHSSNSLPVVVSTWFFLTFFLVHTCAHPHISSSPYGIASPFTHVYCTIFIIIVLRYSGNNSCILSRQSWVKYF
jgi:hypothetical protein